MKLSAKAIRTLKKWASQGAARADELENASAIAHKPGEGKHVKKVKLTPKQKKELAAAEERAKKEASESKIAKGLEA